MVSTWLEAKEMEGICIHVNGYASYRQYLLDLPEDSQT